MATQIALQMVWTSDQEPSDLKPMETIIIDMIVDLCFQYVSAIKQIKNLYDEGNFWKKWQFLKRFSRRVYYEAALK